MYPKENTRLAEQIVALGGALISEFPVGTLPAPQNFPIRNRIISVRSAGVLVVQAEDTAARASLPAVPSNKTATSTPFRAT